jgi:hypothetical protein
MAMDLVSARARVIFVYEMPLPVPTSPTAAACLLVVVLLHGLLFSVIDRMAGLDGLFIHHGHVLVGISYHVL